MIAMARDNPNDYVIPLQLRSSAVAGHRGCLGVLPHAYHQPTVDAAQECTPFLTVYREIYEELFGGEEPERGCRRVLPDWYFGAFEPLGWFRQESNSKSFRLELVLLGYDCVLGNYDFGFLMMVDDPGYWRRFNHHMITNWEVGELTRPLLSTLDKEGIALLLDRKDWNPPGHACFARALERLQEIGDKRRISYPTITTFVA